MKLEQAINLMSELRIKKISKSQNLLEMYDNRYIICINKDEINKQSLQFLNNLVKENNLSLAELGKQYLISANQH